MEPFGDHAVEMSLKIEFASEVASYGLRVRMQLPDTHESQA